MKLFEVTYDGEKLTFRRETDEKKDRMTSEQRYNIIMTAIVALAVCTVLLALFTPLR